MNVNLTSLQSVFNNNNIYQLVLRPIILTVAAIALAIFTVAFISSCLSRRRMNPHTPRMNSSTTRQNPSTTTNTNFTSTTTRTNFTSTTTTTHQNPSMTTLRPNPTAAPRQQPLHFQHQSLHSMVPNYGNNHGVTANPNRTGASALPAQPRPAAQTLPPPQRYLGGTHEIFVRHEDIFIEIPYDAIMTLVAKIEELGLGMSLHVRFTGEPGSDAGGLRRQYISEMFMSLLLNTDRNRDVYGNSGVFKLQVTKNKLQLLIPQEEPTDDPTVSLFYGIGGVMAYVYFNDQIVTGSVFHQAFFDAILCLSDAEIELPYDQLSDATKIKMLKTLVTTQTELGGEDLSLLLPILELLEKGDQFAEDDLTYKVAGFYAAAKMEIEEATTPKGPRDPFLAKDTDGVEYDDINLPPFDKEAIMKDKQGFLNSIMDLILKKDTDSLGKPGLTLCPIHTMAKGMKNVADKANVNVNGRMEKGSRWPEIRRIAPSQSSAAPTSTTPVTDSKALMNKIQGMLDRQILVRSIQLMEHNRTDKIATDQVAWIKSWIEKETTTIAQLERLVFFWTGSTTLGDGAQLHVQTLGGTRLPKSSTCFNRMYIPEILFGVDGTTQFRNDTEEGFHEILEEITQPQQSENFHRM